MASLPRFIFIFLSSVALFFVHHVRSVPVSTGCVTGLAPDRYAFNVGGPAMAAINFGAEIGAYITSPSEVASTDAKILTSPKCKMGALFMSERYSNAEKLSFKVPVPTGAVYKVTTMHAETFFDAPGKRKFHIEINRVRLRTDLDVYKDANGKNKAIKLQHHNIKPTKDGFLNIEFLKSLENPQVNAILIEGKGAHTLIESTCDVSTKQGQGQMTNVPFPSESMAPIEQDLVPSPPTEEMKVLSSAAPTPEKESTPMTAPLSSESSFSSLPSMSSVPAPSMTPSPVASMSSEPAPSMTPSPVASMSSEPAPSMSSDPKPSISFAPVEAEMPSPSPLYAKKEEVGAAPMAKKGGSGMCKSGTYIFCEDFDDLTSSTTSRPNSWVLEDAAKIGLSPANSKALHLTPASSQKGRLIASGLDSTAAVIYGKMSVYVTEFATKPEFAHFVMAELWDPKSPGTEKVRPVGGQYVLNGTEAHSTWGIGSDGGPTGDWTQWRSSVRTEDAKWTCVEWVMNRADNSVEMWLDGVKKPELTVNTDQHTGGHGKFVLPKFTSAWFGWWVFQGDTRPAKFDVYIDDIALATKRIGC